jgi:hypothetical protein
MSLIMLPPRIRWLLAVGSFAFGCYRVIAGDWLGLGLLALSAWLTYGYFKYGTVWLAFRAVAGGQMEKAAGLLQEVRRPEALGGQDRGYFELASGFVCVSRAQNERAEQHLRSALAAQLRTDNDRALAEAVLAQLLVARDELPEARTLLTQAAGRRCRPAIAQRIQSLRAELPPAP